MMLRFTLSTLVLVAALSWPAQSKALDNERSAPVEGPTILAYGLRGFWTGAELGLATGFLATGTHYESGEWRKLVLGAGIGAVVGLTGGITLAVVDASSSRPLTGWLMLRDTGYGSLLGALAGAAIGALFWVDHGRAKNVLTGAAVGTLAGAGAGLVFGLIEGLNAPRRHENTVRSNPRRVMLVIGAVPSGNGMPALVPTLIGRF
jgi:hypothetical protein